MELNKLVCDAGILGAGGAGFPTHVKINCKAEFVLANGAECEPLLRVDQQVMQYFAADVVRGIRAVKEFTGAKRAGGEIGHITVPDPEKAPCSCGKCGCLEQYASANGIVRVTKKRLLEMDTESLLRGASTITCKDVFDAARQQDAFAVETLELIFDYLGEAIASICCVCDPQYVIFGGGVSRQGEFLLEGVKRHFEKYAFHACKSVQFRQATLGNDAGMYGAFRLLLLN